MLRCSLQGLKYQLPVYLLCPHICLLALSSHLFTKPSFIRSHIFSNFYYQLFQSSLVLLSISFTFRFIMLSMTFSLSPPFYIDFSRLSRDRRNYLCIRLYSVNGRTVMVPSHDAILVKVKVKCALVQALRLCTGRTAHRGNRGIALLFLDHGNRRGEG